MRYNEAIEGGGGGSVDPIDSVEFPFSLPSEEEEQQSPDDRNVEYAVDHEDRPAQLTKHISHSDVHQESIYLSFIEG